MRLSEEGKRIQAQAIADSPDKMKAVEISIYTMIGGGFLGASAVNQPGSFYIDSRVGRLPYPKRAILQAVEILALARKMTGADGDGHLIGRDMVDLPNLGIF